MALRNLLLLGLVLACGGGGDGGTMHTAEPVPEEAFCAAWSRVICAKWSECDCDGGGGNCEEDLEAMCPLANGAVTLHLIEDHKVSYDDDGAGELLAWAANLECDALLREVASPTELGNRFGAFEGTTPEGHECEYRSNELTDECRASACSSAEEGVCVVVAAEGEDCDDTTVCVGDAELRCIEGQCAPPIADGEECSADEDCLAENCEGGTCEVRLEVGENCTEDLECASGRCDGATIRCDAPVAEGELCRKDSDCESGDCSREYDPLMPTAAGYCEVPRDVGDDCEVNNDCASGVCVDEECATLVCGLAGLLL